MRGFKNPPLPGEGDPDSLASYRIRYLAWLGERGYSAETVGDRARDLHAFIVWADERSLREPREITRPVLEHYQRHLYYRRKEDGEPLSFRTQRGRLSRIGSFFRWLARENFILTNPAAELELPRPEHRLPSAILSADEAEQILAVPDLSHPMGLRDRAILELLYSSAIRRTELTGLDLFDVDYGRMTILVRLGKGRKDRMVPLGARTKGWLEAYRDQARPLLVCGRDSGRLFLSSTGKPVNPKKLSDRVSRYVEQSGVGKPGACHLFRHTAATLMLDAGADIRFIQQLLGHENLQTTTIYTRVAIAQLQKVHAETHPGAGSVAAQRAKDRTRLDDLLALDDGD